MNRANCSSGRTSAWTRRSAQRIAVLTAGALSAFFLMAVDASASTVGERRLSATQPTAPLRDAASSDQLRVTVWYPAVAGAQEQPLEIGAPGRPLFLSGSAAPDAAFDASLKRPVILLSHGFGGSARMMGWFGTALAREGYVVIAPDHPGNNAIDAMTIAGGALFWERPGDLAVALERVMADVELGPGLDRSRLGVAGFSAGGFTSLAAAGGRVDLARLTAFCAAHPADGVCAPQQEGDFDSAKAAVFLAGEAAAAGVASSGRDLTITGVRAAFAIAPALVQGFDPASLERIDVPVGLVFGRADTTAPPASNSEVAASLVPGAEARGLDGVNHYDFLAECAPQGMDVLPLCRTGVPRSVTHAEVVAMAVRLFDGALGERR